MAAGCADCRSRSRVCSPTVDDGSQVEYTPGMTKQERLDLILRVLYAVQGDSRKSRLERMAEKALKEVLEEGAEVG